MPTVAEGPGTLGTRIVNTNYPIEEGLELGTTRRKTESASLEPEVKLIL